MASLEDFSDSELLELFCTRGADAALAMIEKRHAALVFGIAFGFTRERHTARLVAERVFTRLARDASSIRGRVNLADWLRHATADECDPDLQN